MKKDVYRIVDICEIKSGKRLPKDTDFADYETDYPYIRARDIKDGKINTDALVYLEKDVQEKIKRYIINSGDIAITIVGASVGDVGYALDNVNGYNLTENAVRLTAFSEKVNSKYLFYILYQKQYRDYMQLIAGAAAQPKLGIYKVQQIKVELPDIETQNKVADILSTYDDLIEVNNKRIKSLEQMAENLYKEWFVRFRFPGHKTVNLVESRLGKIPSSFNLIKMNDAFDYYIGGGWGNDEYSTDFPEEAYVIRGTDFPNVQKGNLNTCPLRYHKKNNYSARELKENDIILEVSGGTAEQPVGRCLLVNKDVLDRLGNKVICASFCKLIRLNTEVVTPYYFYHWMQLLYDTRIIDRFQLQSTGIINFKFEYFLRKGDIMLPPKELMDRFDEKVKGLYDEILLLAKQNENLTKQRDLLLPRLMSGKLEV